MTRDITTIERIRHHLSTLDDVAETPIVGGGIGFLVDGHLCCGVSRRGLTVRIGAAASEEALTRPHVRPLQLGSRRAAAFVVVDPEGYRSEAAFVAWLNQALAFVDSLG